MAARLEKDAVRHAERDEKQRQYPDLTSPEQLPDIETKKIIITLREEDIYETNSTGDIWKDTFVVFYWKKQEIWRVPATFEYYRSYLHWGEF